MLRPTNHSDRAHNAIPFACVPEAVRFPQNMLATLPRKVAALCARPHCALSVESVSIDLHIIIFSSSSSSNCTLPQSFSSQAYARRHVTRTRTAPRNVCRCKDVYAGYKAKGYSDLACIDLAKNGFMCSDQTGVKMKCDAIAAGFVKGHADCVGGKVFTECGSACPLTCDNMGNTDMVCPKMCVVGCFCKGNTPIWDDATEMCMAGDTCPGKNQCEGTIGENYLNTGSLKSVCKGTEDDDVCYSSGCVTASNVIQPRRFNPVTLPRVHCTLCARGRAHLRSTATDIQPFLGVRNGAAHQLELALNTGDCLI